MESDFFVNDIVLAKIFVNSQLKMRFMIFPIAFWAHEAQIVNLNIDIIDSLCQQI